MRVEQVMHFGVDGCAPWTPLVTVARMMRDDDIGVVPIEEEGRLVGIVTDRDIVCRTLAAGRDPSRLTARDVMTTDIVHCSGDEDVGDAIRRMEERGVRRLPVLDRTGRVIGMLSFGDISHTLSHETTGELAEAVTVHHC